MSHHLDSPIARQDPRLDITDFYLFGGETGTVFILNVCHSLAGNVTTPGFHHEGKYEFKVDLAGDAVEDVTYRATFGERGSDGIQTVQLRRLVGAAAADDFAEGELLLEGVTGQEVTGADGLRLWAGKAGDPFWIEPDVLHAVGHAFQDGTRINLGDWTPAQAKNLFAGHTVYSLVLEVPASHFSAAPDGRLGAWSVASLATDAGGWRMINRAGLPMIHPLFTQFNEELGDNLNGGGPSQDYATYGELVTKEIASVVAAYGVAGDPDAYAEAVTRRFFPNVLPYVVGTPATFGFAGFNGRTLTDNAPDVMFSLAANTPVTLSLGPESVDPKPRTGFPYVPEAN